MPSWQKSCGRPWVLPIADACGWLLRLLSPLLSEAAPAVTDGTDLSCGALDDGCLFPLEAAR